MKVSDFLDDLLIVKESLKAKIKHLERLELKENILKAREEFLGRKNLNDKGKSTPFEAYDTSLDETTAEFLDKITRQTILELLKETDSMKQPQKSDFKPSNDLQNELSLVDETLTKLTLIKREIQQLQDTSQKDLTLENQVREKFYFNDVYCCCSLFYVILVKNLNIYDKSIN